MRFLLVIALVLSGGFNSALADGAAARADALVQPASQIFRSQQYGFELELPEGWAARETDFYFAHYSRVFLTVNSQRPDLKIQDLRLSQQMQPGEVYVSFSYFEGPFMLEMRSDTVGNDLHSRLATNGLSESSSPGLLCLGLGFFKRGVTWGISACLREPVTEENRRKVMAMLNSFRFVDFPVGNVSWAESLAWKELPANIRTAQAHTGWPVVTGLEPQTQRAMHGPRSVVVEKINSAYSIKFTLNGIGTWQYSVLEDGRVQPQPPVIATAGLPASQLPSDLPGEGKGLVNAYWISPYVQESEAFGKRTITWFFKDGSIKRQTPASAGEGDQSGFAMPTSGKRRVEGINEDWRIAVRPFTSGPEPRHIASTPDSRVFFNQFCPKPGRTALDVYIHGKQVNTLGPFVPHSPSGDVVVNDDGSAALLFWQDDAKSNTQIVVLGTNGKIQFRADCGRDVYSPIVAPEGAGVLLRPNTGGTNQNNFMWFTRQGKLRSIDISPNPEFVGWIPRSRKALFLTRLGNETRNFQLIDWDTGKQLWNIHCPADGELLAFGLTPDLGVLAVAQPYQSPQGSLPDLGKEWIRAFYAINVQDGSVVAQWRAQFPHRSAFPKHDHFLQLGDRFYFVSEDEFAELNLDDMTSKKNGWR